EIVRVPELRAQRLEDGPVAIAPSTPELPLEVPAQVTLHGVVVEQRIIDVEQEYDRRGLRHDYALGVGSSCAARYHDASRRVPRRLRSILGLSHAVAARLETRRHGAFVILGRCRRGLRLVGRVRGIEPGLANGPLVALIAIVRGLLFALTVLRVDEEAHRALACGSARLARGRRRGSLGHTTRDRRRVRDDVPGVIRAPRVVDALPVVVRHPSPPVRHTAHRKRPEKPREVPPQVDVGPEPAMPIAAAPVMRYPVRPPRAHPIARTRPTPIGMHADPVRRPGIAGPPPATSSPVTSPPMSSAPMSPVMRAPMPFEMPLVMAAATTLEVPMLLRHGRGHAQKE